MGCHSLLQRIFPTWGSNLGFLLCRQILHHLSHQGSLHLWKGNYYSKGLVFLNIERYWQIPLQVGRTNMPSCQQHVWSTLDTSQSHTFPHDVQIILKIDRIVFVLLLIWFVASLWDVRGPGPPARGPARVLCSGSRVLTTGPPRSPLQIFLTHTQLVFVKKLKLKWQCSEGWSLAYWLSDELPISVIDVGEGWEVSAEADSQPRLSCPLTSG